MPKGIKAPTNSAQALQDLSAVLASRCASVQAVTWKWQLCTTSPKILLNHLKCC